ncbi:MAG: hypothetical protein ACPHF4_15210, partial [Rubripirellula sp.]
FAAAMATLTMFGQYRSDSGLKKIFCGVVAVYNVAAEKSGSNCKVCPDSKTPGNRADEYSWFSG